MISIKIPGHAKKESTTYWPPVLKSDVTEPVNNVVQNMLDEAKRRDTIVRRLYASFPLNPGDTATASNATIAATIGEKLIVVAVAKSYSELGKDSSWPEGDNPLMVHVKSYDKKGDFFVSTNAVKKRND